jgi:5-methylcytosine-specific restriction endonuclease McrA
MRSNPAHYAAFYNWFKIWKADKVAVDPNWNHPLHSVDPEVFIQFCQKTNSTTLDNFKVQQVLEVINARRDKIVAAQVAAQDAQADEEKAAKAREFENHAHQSELFKLNARMWKNAASIAKSQLEPKEEKEGSYCSDEGDSSTEEEDSGCEPVAMQPMDKLFLPSTALAPFITGDMNDAILSILPFLPPSMATNPTSVSYLAAQAMHRQMDTSTFLTFLAKEREFDESNAARVEAKAVREHEENKAARRRRRIREPELRLEMETVFGADFEAPCDFDCGRVVNATFFHVARVNDELHVCCRECYLVKRREGVGTRRMRMTPARVRCWMGRHGSSVVGHCFHCGPSPRGAMHVLLDPWHAGHDIAQSKGGTTEATNLAPLHAQCNRNQGTESFDEYV